jgi:hypothetical protein
MKKLWWLGIALAVSVILNTVAVRVGRGSYAHIMFVLHVILFVGLPTFVASLILMIMGREKRWNLFLAGYALNLVSLVVGLMIASTFIGLFVANRDVTDAKAYCQSLVPRLEKHKEDTGRYPEDVAAVSARDNEPLLLAGKRFYIPQADGYVMEFRDPSKKQRMVEYSSWKKEWQRRQ